MGKGIRDQIPNTIGWCRGREQKGKKTRLQRKRNKQVQVGKSDRQEWKDKGKGRGKYIRTCKEEHRIGRGVTIQNKNKKSLGWG